MTAEPLDDIDNHKALSNLAEVPLILKKAVCLLSSVIAFSLQWIATYLPPAPSLSSPHATTCSWVRFSGAGTVKWLLIEKHKIL